MPNDPTPPQMYNREAEEGLLGAALIQPQIVASINVLDSDFFFTRHRWLWAAIRDLLADGAIPDIITISEMLDRRNQLAEVGGAAFLTGLVNCTPSWLQAAEYAKIIVDYRQRRLVLAAANNLAKVAYTTETNIYQETSGVINELKKESRMVGCSSHISETVSRVYDNVMERVKEPVDIWGVPTGFYDFDRLFGGLQPGDLVLFIGGPAIGKSVLLGQIAINIALAQEPTLVAFYSLEMTNFALVRRMLSANARVVTRGLKTGRLDQDEINSFTASVDRLSTAPIYLYDKAKRGPLTIEALRNDLYRLTEVHGTCVVILDYLLKMHGPGKDENEKSAYLSDELKTLALELEVPIVVANSVTKEGMDTTRVSMRHSRGSGQVVHEGDIIGNLVRPDDPGKEEILQIKFTKARDEPARKCMIELIARSDFPALDTPIAKEVELPYLDYTV